MNAPQRDIYDAGNAKMLCAGAADAYAPNQSAISQIVMSGRHDILAVCSTFASEFVISFRGTVNLLNWLEDVDCVFARLGGGLCVSMGFWLPLLSVYAELNKAVMEARSKGMRIWITGHSLGGALAMLFAWNLVRDQRLQPFAGIYTFGQPRCGNLTFAQSYSFHGLHAVTHRVVHANDIVARMPWILRCYHHAGHETFYPNLTPNVTLFDPSILIKLPYDILNGWREWTQKKIALLADHHIATYQALFQS